MSTGDSSADGAVLCGPPHVYLTGRIEVDEADAVELRGTWEYAYARQCSQLQKHTAALNACARRPGTQLKCEQLKFWYARARSADDCDENMSSEVAPLGEVNGGEPRSPKKNSASLPPWAGLYEGWFVLKLHGREHKVAESFLLWREDKLNGKQSIGVAGRGANSYGKFFLRGALEDGSRLRLERVYGAKVSKRGGTSPRRRRPHPVQPALHNLRRHSPPQSESPEEDAPCRASKRQRVVRWRNDGDDARPEIANPWVAPPSSPDGGLTATSRSSPRRTTNDHYAESSATGRPPSSPRACSPKGGCMRHHASQPLAKPPRSPRGVDASCQTWCLAVYDEEVAEIYEGELCPKTGLRHGLGACVYVSRDQQIYEGEWKLGREHGRGTVLTRDRRVVFDGEFVDGKIHGRGVYVFTNGDVYHGDWRENCRHGTGIYVLADDRGSYSGDWRDNARYGRGKFVDAAGSSYEGEWVNDRMHGRGSLRLSSGLAYDGSFADNAFDGRGICVYPDGQRYEGMWRGGRRDGRGSLVWPNGASYEGRFKDDNIDGQGTLNITKATAEGPDGVCLLVPIDLKTDIAKIHLKAGFDQDGN